MRVELFARACAIATLACAGCGGSDEPEAPAPVQETSAPAEDPPADTAPAPPADSGSTASPAINSVTVDPGDGTIMIGSGPALYRVAPGAEAEQLTGQLAGGTVSGNLVVRFAGTNDLLASGHPQEGDLPENSA